MWFLKMTLRLTSVLHTYTHMNTCIPPHMNICRHTDMHACTDTHTLKLGTKRKVTKNTFVLKESFRSHSSYHFPPSFFHWCLSVCHRVASKFPGCVCCPWPMLGDCSVTRDTCKPSPWIFRLIINGKCSGNWPPPTIKQTYCYTNIWNLNLVSGGRDSETINRMISKYYLPAIKI